MSDPSDLETPRPALIVGVTGHRAISDEIVPLIRDRVRQVLEWLRGGRLEVEGCEEPLGLEATPILVLSPLAPGADQIVAEEAAALGCKLRYPLPFPPDLYARSSTFHIGGEQLELSDDLLAKIGGDDAFLVRRGDDVSLSDAEMKARLAADIDEPEGRNLRYRAVGEYVSTHSDILIAICDQKEIDEEPNVTEGLPPLAQAGARRLVRSHLTGLEPGILPVETTLSWADNGPVIRIFCPKTSDVDAVRDTPIEFWHPHDSEVPEEFEAQHHRRQMGDLRGFADHLESLNAALPQRVEPGTSQAEKMFAKKNPYRPQTFLDRGRDPSKPAPPQPGPPISPRLERIARARRLVANINYGLDARAKKHTRNLFVLAIGSVVVLQLFENWIPPGTTGSTPVWRTMCFYAAVSALSFGFFYHWQKKRTGLFDRQNDYRALVEALRVQFYWAAAGLGISAASNYLQRARGELSWIRAAVASISLPFEPERQRFRALSDREKYTRLQGVCNGWLSEQEWFFTRASHRQARAKNRRKVIANFLIIAGIALVLANFAQAAYPDSGFATACRRHASHHGLWAIALWLLVAAAIWFAVQVVTSRTWRAYHDEKKPDRWVALSDRLSMFRNPLWTIAGGVSLGWAIFCAIRGTAPGPYVPGHAELDTFAKNLLVASGGLLHAFNAVKFADENTKRYTAMRDLFRPSRRKLEALLERYQEQIEGGAPEEQKAHSVRAIQSYLAAIGKEALHENTDWLQMHRNKPIEPVLPM